MGLKDPAILALQREMVDEQKTLSDTSVGKDLSNDIMAVKSKYENELKQLKAELDEAKKANDTTLVQELSSIETETLSLAADSEQLLDGLFVLPQDLAFEREGFFESESFVLDPEAFDKDFSLFIEPSTWTSNRLGSESNSAPVERRQMTSRATRSRHSCPVPDCGKAFVYPRDVDRHLRQAHNQGKGSFECSFLACQYRTHRRDNVLEHCRRMHYQTRGAETYTTNGEVWGSSLNATTLDTLPSPTKGAAEIELKRPREEDSISGSDNNALVGLPPDKRSRIENATEARGFIEVADERSVAEIAHDQFRRALIQRDL